MYLSFSVCVSCRELSEAELSDLALDLRPYMERTPFVVRPAACNLCHVTLLLLLLPLLRLLLLLLLVAFDSELLLTVVWSQLVNMSPSVRAGASSAGVPAVPGPGAAPPVRGAGAAHGGGPAHPQGRWQCSQYHVPC